MTIVTVSPKFQVVIPLAVRQRQRQRLKLQPSAKRQVIELGGGLRLVPLTPPSALRGIDTRISHDDDRPL